jgi:hypothetical protein
MPQGFQGVPNDLIQPGAFGLAAKGRASGPNYISGAADDGWRKVLVLGQSILRGFIHRESFNAIL